MSGSLSSSSTIFWVYVLENEAGGFYVGQTDDLDRRVAEHNEPAPADGKYTLKNGPWRLVWREPHSTRSSAMQRERQIKRMKSVSLDFDDAAQSSRVPDSRDYPLGSSSSPLVGELPSSSLNSRKPRRLRWSRDETAHIGERQSRRSGTLRSLAEYVQRSKRKSLPADIGCSLSCATPMFGQYPAARTRVDECSQASKRLAHDRRPCRFTEQEWLLPSQRQTPARSSNDLAPCTGGGSG